MRCFQRIGFGVICLAVFGAAWAQETPPAEGPPLSAWATPQGVVRAFQQACVLTGGEETAAVDWALSVGFEPADALRGSVEGLLAGQAGSVLAAPGTRGMVLLAAAQGRQCTVWADQMVGPAVRMAMAEMLGVLSGKGAKVQLQADRSVERAGAWRNQSQWRYRAVGTTQDLGLGAVTTLTSTPGTQALNAGPLPVTPAYAPDGLPTR
jgi:hypothetical protein